MKHNFDAKCQCGHAYEDHNEWDSDLDVFKELVEMLEGDNWTMLTRPTKNALQRAQMALAVCQKRDCECREFVETTEQDEVIAEGERKWELATNR